MNNIKLFRVAFRKLHSGERLYGIIQIGKEHYFLIRESEEAHHLILFPCCRASAGIDEVLFDASEFVLIRDVQGNPYRIAHRE